MTYSRVPEQINEDPFLVQAINEIYSTYGDTVSIQEKKKSLLKFGRNELVSTSGSTVMTLPSGVDEETYISTNGITSISSSNNGDTQEVSLEGHTISGSDLTFTVQTVTLTGQTTVTLSTALARATRLINKNSTNFAGQIYVYETDTTTGGVPDTNSKVHLMTRANGVNQSEKASTSISSVDYWIVTEYYGSVLEKTNIYADFELQSREIGGVFVPLNTIAASSGIFSHHPFTPYRIIRKNSDVRIQATAGSSNTDCIGGIEGYLAIVT